MFENLEPSDCGLASTSGLITYQTLSKFSANFLSQTAIYSITITVICYCLIISHFRNSQLNSKKLDYEQEKLKVIEMQEQQNQNQTNSQAEIKVKLSAKTPNKYVVSFSLLKLTEKDVLLCAIVGLGIACLIELTGNIKTTVFGLALYPWFGFLAVPLTAMVISLHHKLNSNTQSLSVNQDKV